MLTTLIDLFTTGTAIGLVTTLAAVGVAVLPWRATEAQGTAHALDAFARYCAGLASAAFQTAAGVGARSVSAEIAGGL